MQPYQKKFLEFAISRQVLRFGQFTLKSGRQSPYFFNAGLFDSGAALAQLGGYYANAITDSGIAFDSLFGPAYKGIPLAAATAIALSRERGRDIPFAFNRKEAKDHGEGGNVVGAALEGRVLIIDDVISAGTSVRESLRIIQSHGAKAVGVAIALDRQERGSEELSAVQEVEQQGLAVCSIVGLAELVEFLAARSGAEEELSAIHAYRQTYGIEPSEPS